MIGGGSRHLGMRELFQAVRSQLHFSQLGAWWSSSGGRSPAHVVYRLSVPTGMLMASSFVLHPLVHHFPSASLGRGTSTLEVSLSSLPRMESVPRLSCSLHPRDDWKQDSAGNDKKEVLNQTAPPASLLREEKQRPGIEEYAIASSASSWNKEGRNGSGGKKRQLLQLWALPENHPPAANSILPEPLLGESLLDPPPWERRGPVHGPGHLPPPPSSIRTALPVNMPFLRDTPFAGKNVTSHHNTDQSSPDSWKKNCTSCSPKQSHLSENQVNTLGVTSSCRLSRQGLARRRDLQTPNSTLRIRVRGQNSPPYPSVPFVVDDRMQMPCNRPGKHHCQHAEDDDGENEEEGRGSRFGSGKCRVKECGDGGCGSEDAGLKERSCEASKKKQSLQLSQMEVEEVLEVLRRNNSSRRQCKKGGEEEEGIEKTTNLLCTKGSPDLSAHFPVTQVYQMVAEKNINPIAKASSLLSKKKSYSKENLVRNSISHSDVDSSIAPVSLPPSTNSSTVASTNELKIAAEIERNEQENHVKDGASPIQCGSNGTIGRPVPSAREKARFRKSLDSAASMVFHCRTGLPLTSSPAPIRRGTRFDFDSSLNSVSAIRSALFESGERSEENEEEAESGSPPETPPTPTIIPPVSPREKCLPPEGLPLTNGIEHTISSYNSCALRSIRGPRLLLPSGAPSPTSASLLGSFEESVLNGRLEPVSTVQGFTAEIGASGPTSCPKHLFLPVTVFFYTLGDNDKVSTPYLGHINLGRKGYCVPRSGTVQVTLFNPLGTVVKMFVVLYDLSDMPALSQTFLRQRTLYVPASSSEDYSRPGNPEAHKWLRYLIHLRFSSSKSGRIYLHTDIRMIIFRKSDLDTATASSTHEEAYELRSFTHGPTNPKFSPTK